MARYRRRSLRFVFADRAGAGGRRAGRCASRISWRSHLFQGWADQFLSTPRQGIRDTLLSASAKIESADYQAGDAASGKVDLTRLWVTLIYSC